MREERLNAQASVLDRLLDDAPGVSHEPVQFRLQEVGQVKASVARDLENLLNTKRPAEEPPAALRHVGGSLLVYGLGDLSAHNPRSTAVRQQLRQDIERTIARFEPRLRNVAVQFEADRDNDRVLRFRISGILKVEPLSEPVTFDTVLDVSKVRFTIAE